MATATLTKLQNFIDGEFVDPADGETEEVLNPATGEAIAEAPLSTAEDVDRAVAAAQGGLRRLGDDDARRARAGAAEARRRDRGARRRARRPRGGQRRQAAHRRSSRTRSRSMVDNLRFFAGAARCLEGRASGEYTGGLHLDHPPRAGRRRRPDHARGTTR